jgi:UDP-glucose 4-epimerase
VKILITGGAGFIGSYIVEYFKDKAAVIVLDNFRSGFKHNLEDFRCEFMQGSILDRELVRRAMRGVDYVFHLAALVSVAESMQKPFECAETNTIGTLVVLEESGPRESEEAGLEQFCRHLWLQRCNAQSGNDAA